MKAEIIWILKSICNGYSNRSCEQLNSTLKAMFPDSKIAEAFLMGRTKSMYLINHGLAPFFKSLLLSELNKSDILLKVNVRFIGSTFFGHETLQNLLKHFRKLQRSWIIRNCIRYQWMVEV